MFDSDTLSGLLLKDQIGFLFPYTVYAEPYAEDYFDLDLDLGMDTYYEDAPGQAYSQGDSITFQEHNNNYWRGNL